MINRNTTTYIKLAVIFLTVVASVSIFFGCAYPADENTYTANEELILEKIHEIGALKVSGSKYKAQKEDLATLGAVLSEKKLSEIKLAEPIEKDGKLVETMADIAKSFDGVLEFYGIEKDISIGSKTYNTLEVIIQNTYSSGPLTSTIIQNGRSGWDIFTDIEPISVPYGYTAVSDNNTEKNNNADDNSAQGDMKWYMLNPIASSTVSLIFIENEADKWHHIGTANYVNISETHYWYMNQDTNGKENVLDGLKNTETEIVPDGYDERVIMAVQSYENGNTLYTVTTNQIVVPTNKEAIELNEAKEHKFTMQCICPITITEFASITHQ